MKYLHHLNSHSFSIYRTKWKRQTSVGFELLVEAGNYAAYQRAYRNYPQMDAWQYPPAMLPGSPLSAELYYRQASLAALQQGHSPYGLYPVSAAAATAAAAAAAAASINLSKPATTFPMYNNSTSATTSPNEKLVPPPPAALNPAYYDSMRRLAHPQPIRSSTSPLSIGSSSPPLNTSSAAAELQKKTHDTSDDEEHIEV